MTKVTKIGEVRFRPSLYFLKVTPDVLHYRDDAFVEGNTISIKAYRRGEEEVQVNNGEVLITVRNDATSTVETSITGAASYTVTSDMNYITISLTDTGKAKTYEIKTVAVVRDGKDGEDGEKGEKGDTGPSYYMAGSYDADTSYTRDAYKAPVVELDGLYYGMVKDGTYTGVNPKTDVAANGGTWNVFDMFKYVFAEVAFVKFGKLASAVFNGNFMYSQYGVTSGGAVTDAYESFDASLADPTANEAFMPNILLDFYNGKAWFGNIVAKGTIEADAGYIGGFTINNQGLSTSQEDAHLAFEFSGSKFLRINRQSDSALIYGRRDDGTLMSLAAYGDSAIALDLLANTAGYGYALSSIGAAKILSRYDSELVTITGLALGCRTGTSFMGTTQNITSPSTSWVDFLVATGNITLPTANTCPGKILFVKFTGTYTVSSSSYIIDPADNSSTTSKTRVSKAVFYISNGTSWYEFYCG